MFFCVFGVDVDFESELKELMKRTGSDNIVDLSMALSVSESTIRTWKNRNKVPEKIIKQSHEILRLRLNNKSDSFNGTISGRAVSKEALKNYIMEGLFRAVQGKGMTLAKDARIGSIADILIDEIENSDPHFFIKPSKKTG